MNWNDPTAGATRTSLMVLIVCVLALSACGGDGAADTAGDDAADAAADTDTTDAGDDDAGDDTADGDLPDSGEITFVATFPQDAVEPAIAAWNEEHPDLTVNYEELPFGDLNEVIRTRIGSGDATPDVYAADQPRIAALVDDGLLTDLTDDFDDAGDLFDPSTVEVSTVDGTLYAAPVNTSMVVLYYNTELLEAAGIDAPGKQPDDRLTWEELAELAADTQDAGATWGFQIFRVGQIFQMQPLAESLGGGSGMDTDTDPHTPELTNDGWIESMEFFAQLHEDEISPRGVAVEEVPELFAAGELAYFLGTTAHHDGWAYDIDGVEYGIAPHPYFADGDAVTPTGAWSLGVNPNTENEAIARAFVRFVTATPEGSEAWAEGVGNIPANVETQAGYFENPIYADDDEYATAELIDYELNNTARNRARTPDFIEFETILEDTFDDIRNGQPVAETLENAEEELQGGRGR